MSAPFIPKVESLPADFWTDRGNQPIVAIVVHGTGGTDSRDTLQHGGGRKVSIHRLINKAGKIYKMVGDGSGANHAGAPTSSFTINGKTYSGGQVNRSTLGIELESMQTGRNDYTNPQLEAMGWQIAEWRKLHGPLPILRHADIDPTRRRDPYQLSTQEIEQWAAKYQAPIMRTVTAGPYGAIAAQDRKPEALAAAYFPPGTKIPCDDFTNGFWHVSDGIGFIPAGQVLP